MADDGFDELAHSLPPADRDMMIAAGDVIGRMGARQFEVGYTDDDRAEDWYATVYYGGHREIAEHYPEPHLAADALARRLMSHGGCKCGRRVTLLPRRGACLWRREGPRWLAGCTAPSIEVKAARGDIGALQQAWTRRTDQIAHAVVHHGDGRRGRRKGDRLR